MSIQLNSIAYEFPNGHEIFRDLKLSLSGHTKYGLVGANGVGKSTLARVIAGELQPTQGSMHSELGIFYLPQDEPMLSSSPHLSGGEWMRARIAKAMSSHADFIVLDEPSNNLDLQGRTLLIDFVKGFTGGLLIISHDRELLEHVDVILELSNTGLTRFGGNWSFYNEHSQREQAHLEQSLRRSQLNFKKSKVHQNELIARQEKRMRHGKANARRRGLSKIEVSGMKRNAQITKSSIDKKTTLARNQALEKVSESLQALKSRPHMYAEFPETEVSPSKLVCCAEDLNIRFHGEPQDLWPTPLTFTLRGPAKVALTGNNGSGKSTLLRLITGQPIESHLTGHIERGHLQFSLIDQRLSMVDSAKTVLENVMVRFSGPISEARNLLAPFLFTGDATFQEAATLSGGEKLRLALAMALLSSPAPQLLILDEPTNNADIETLDFLVAALNKFKGALVLVSHDQVFLKEMGITDEIHLEPKRREKS